MSNKFQIVKTYFIFLLMNIIIFTITLPVFCKNTQNHPKIGLVLSGGGARGAAHIGVIKALEEMQIPIDYITGTSIGALIGGMYASGIPVDEIENFVKSIDWTNIFDDTPSFNNLSIRKKQEVKKYIHPLNIGIKNFKIKMPKSIVTGQKINFIIQSIMLKGKQTNDFNSLPIPFRVIATDIATGKMVVIEKGNLGKAILGSMSIPGVFAPVKYNNYLLVDGGLTNNIPIKAVKDLGADIVIAVDIAAGLIDGDKLDNALSLTRQMLKIMMQNSTDKQLAFLSSKDILITPNLKNIDSAQFDKLDYSCKAGYKATINNKNKLSLFSVSNKKYQKYLKNKLKIINEKNTIVKNIIVSDDSNLNPDFFLKRIKTKPGDKLDLKQLQKDFETIYQTGYFEFVDFEFDTEKNLLVNVKNKSQGKNIIQLGFNFSDNFKGNNNLDFIISLTKAQINSLAGELKFEIILGSRQSFFAEYFQPLDIKTSYFFSFSSMYLKEKTDFLINTTESINDFSYQKFISDIAIGKNINNWGQLKWGIRFQKGSTNLLDLSEKIDFTENYRLNEFEHIGYFVDLSMNTMNKPYLATYGSSLNINYFKTFDILSLDNYMYDKYYFNYKKVFTKDTNSFLFKAVYGSSLKNNPPPYDGFKATGLLGFTGSHTGRLTGNHLFQSGIYYYKEVAKIRSMYKVFLGGSIEAGNVWLNKNDIDFGNLYYSASTFSALETPVGPLYLGLNYTENFGYYLFLSVGSIF